MKKKDQLKMGNSFGECSIDDEEEGPKSDGNNTPTQKNLGLDINMIGARMLKPGAHPRVGNPEVTGIPQVDSSTRQRQLISTQAEVTYLTKPPITTKPVVRTN